MDQTRMGEIALKIVKEMMKKKGIHLGTNLKRELGNEAKRLGITRQEALAFSRAVIEDLVRETFDAPDEPESETET
jgi:hypothetical protein